MGFTLGAIGLLTGSVTVLICWVEEIVLTNIPENHDIVMVNAVFHKSKDRQKMN
ncbi:hypothetical protein [Holospora curviuscula]|uniref:Uncharacterized protein n=1 Tax=Holospora curviuscula TaxID=1082868 RepID=A0A2S5R930_9PROT|nr:hypothetical protein [Holospora curviuscula]PPE03793.1 hypothetical protein HCUR_00808 [Holospora curviuscula]